jgi:hypothetical protein
MWNARGTSEWAMLIHAPDCFLNDEPGLGSLLGLLDSLDPSKSSLMLPTVVFGRPQHGSSTACANGCTAADIFKVFNSRACAALCSYRHVPVFDPHMVQVSRVHEALDGFSVDARAYTASLAVHHYVNFFSDREMRSIFSISSDGIIKLWNGSVPMCADTRMSEVSTILSQMLAACAANE